MFILTIDWWSESVIQGFLGVENHWVIETSIVQLLNCLCFLTWMYKVLSVEKKIEKTIYKTLYKTHRCNFWKKAASYTPEDTVQGMIVLVAWNIWKINNHIPEGEWQNSSPVFHVVHCLGTLWQRKALTFEFSSEFLQWAICATRSWKKHPCGMSVLNIWRKWKDIDILGFWVNDSRKHNKICRIFCACHGEYVMKVKHVWVN